MSRRIASIRATPPAPTASGTAARPPPGNGVPGGPRGEDLARRALIARQAAVLHAIADFQGHRDLVPGLLALADGLRERFGAGRVAVGLIERDAIAPKAISQRAPLAPGSDDARLIAAALHEACGAGEPTWRAPAGTAGEASPPDALPAHRALVSGRPGTGVATAILYRGETVLGALLAEVPAGAIWNAPKRRTLQHVADALGPMIDDRRVATATPARRVAHETRRALAALLAPRRLVAKLSTAALALVVAALVLVPLDHRVTADAELVAERLRTVTAPATGYVRTVSVGAGDAVREGDPLFELDTTDLELEAERLGGELATAAAELRAARAEGDRKRTAMLGARAAQARAELALAERRIARSRVVAPHDGRVLGGALERLVGAPVERGQPLLELAPTLEPTIDLLVDERDVGLLAPGQRGALALLARPGERLALEITGVEPIAVAGGGRNRFRVGARLTGDAGGAAADLLPGQTGVAKVHVGEAGALALASRRTRDWARLTLWEWFGR